MLVDVCLFIFFNNTRASSQRLNFITIIIIIDNNIHESGSKTLKILTRKRNVVLLVLAKVRYTAKVIRCGTLSLWRNVGEKQQKLIFVDQLFLLPSVHFLCILLRGKLDCFSDFLTVARDGTRIKCHTIVVNSQNIYIYRYGLS